MRYNVVRELPELSTTFGTYSFGLFCGHVLGVGAEHKVGYIVSIASEKLTAFHRSFSAMLELAGQ